LRLNRDGRSGDKGRLLAESDYGWRGTKPGGGTQAGTLAILKLRIDQ
jgi:hypothetical protein